MTVTYTTTAKVSSFLQLETAFGVGTRPTSAEVEQIINRKEDFIDERTGHAWRVKTVTNEYVNSTGFYTYGTGLQFILLNREIRTFDGNSGDKIEIWDGSNWVDYVATKTEGRNADYWVDYSHGIIFILDKSFMYRHGFRVTYRYGATTVPYDIEEACTLLVACDVLSMYERNLTYSDDGGSNKPTIDQKIMRWRDHAMMILRERGEVFGFL